jgi:hypothetical protein
MAKNPYLLREKQLNLFNFFTLEKLFKLLNNSYEKYFMPESSIDRISLDVAPLTLHIGTEIQNVDLSRPLSDQHVADIKATLAKWKVVFFSEPISRP